MTRSFEYDQIQTFKALRADIERFENDALNENLVCDCKVWHLCDHIFEYLGPNSPFKKLADVEKHAKDTYPEIATSKIFVTHRNTGRSQSIHPASRGPDIGPATSVETILTSKTFMFLGSK